MSLMRAEVAFVTCLAAPGLLAACDVNQGSMSLDETGSSGVDSGDSSSASASTNSDSSDASASSSSSDTGSDSAGDGSLPGCDGDGEASQPFGNHEGSYANGVILPDHKTQSELDWETTQFYDGWKQRYLRQGCGDGRYYVDAGISGKATVSEAHGYGMMIMAYMAGYDADARTVFDGMFHYYEDHPSGGDARLLAWSQDSSCQSNDGLNSATDGDLDVAYALLLADKQWGSAGDIDYAAEAGQMLSGIWQSETGDGFVQLGDWISSGEYANATRGSDFMPSHFASFEAALGDGNWEGVRSGTYGTFASIQNNYSSSTGLIPDFILNAAGSPTPAPPNWLEGSYDGEYGFNSCRVPWRVGLDFVINGDSRSRDTVTPLNQWIRSATGDSAADIAAGYWLDGDGLPGSNYTELAFIAPFGVAAMVDASNQNWLNQIWNQVVTFGGNPTYYGDSIAMLDLIIMSGNYWAPENTPCAE
jgi:endo-1,4-beta-D-glucanase Y